MRFFWKTHRKLLKTQIFFFFQGSKIYHFQNEFKINHLTGTWIVKNWFLLSFHSQVITKGEFMEIYLKTTYMSWLDSNLV